MGIPIAKPTYSLPSAGVAETSALPPPTSKINLPAAMDLQSLMTWLATKMRKSDEEIRTKMSAMSDRKEIQSQLTKLTSDFRTARSGADTGGGWIDASLIEDPAKIKASDWYKALDSDTRNKIDAMLSLIAPPCYTANSAFYYNGPEGKTWKVEAGHVFTAEDVEKYGIDKSKLNLVPQRMKKEEFENVVQSLGDITKELSSSDEIQMIELQSAISARGQLLQMVSNMIATANNTAMNTVSNFRG